MSKPSLTRAVASLFIGGAITITGVLPAIGDPSSPMKDLPPPTTSELTPLEKVDEAQLDLIAPLPAEDLYKIAKLSSRTEPLEVEFRSGEWSGGVVVAGYSERSKKLIDHFLRDSEAAQGENPIVSISGSHETVSGHILNEYSGNRSHRPEVAHNLAVNDTQVDDTQVDNEEESSPHTGILSLPCQDCDIPINNGSSDPDIPDNGRLSQLRMQGVMESTDHLIEGLDKKGYPAVLHVVAMTQGRAGTVKPMYIYEHDYKVARNGYVESYEGYDWTTNLPGAYRDTRAMGLEGGDLWLDFTIGSAFTWMLDGNKTYTIRTLTLSPQTAPKPSSSARLTASVVPNDGGLSPSSALLHRGCHFPVNPSTYPAASATTPTHWTGDLAWCGGIGDFGHPSFVKNISLISLNPFFIKFDGTCRNWTTGFGFKWC